MERLNEIVGDLWNCKSQIGEVLTKINCIRVSKMIIEGSSSNFLLLIYS